MQKNKYLGADGTRKCKSVDTWTCFRILRGTWRICNYWHSFSYRFFSCLV